MNTEDIRWIQRLENYSKAVDNLQKAVNQNSMRSLSELEKQGFIKAFEICFELSWKVLKDYFKWQGNPDIHGSRDSFKEAFNQNIISDGKIFMKMIETRNNSIHTYDEEVIDNMIKSISNVYFNNFVILLNNLIKISNEKN